MQKKLVIFCLICAVLMFLAAVSSTVALACDNGNGPHYDHQDGNGPYHQDGTVYEWKCNPGSTFQDGPLTGCK